MINAITTDFNDGVELSLDQLETISGGGALDTLIKIGAAIDAAGKIYDLGKKVLQKADDALSGLIC
jgi:hypothetical protein